MKVTFSEKEVVDALLKFADIPTLKLKLSALRGVDWNPFNEDGDAYVGVFGELNHNIDLMWDAALAIANCAERLVIGGIQLTNQQKHKAVVEALDRAIRVPFFLEPFDGILIDILVSGAVKWFNKFGWGDTSGLVIELKPVEDAPHQIEP